MSRYEIKTFTNINHFLDAKLKVFTVRGFRYIDIYSICCVLLSTLHTLHRKILVLKRSVCEAL